MGQSTSSIFAQINGSPLKRGKSHVTNLNQWWEALFDDRRKTLARSNHVYNTFKMAFQEHIFMKKEEKRLHLTACVLSRIIIFLSNTSYSGLDGNYVVNHEEDHSFYIKM